MLILGLRWNVCVAFLYLANNAESALRFSRQTSNWTDALASCQEFGGSLATFDHLDDLRRWMSTSPTGSLLSTGTEIWVGVRLVTSPWKWEGESGVIYRDVKSYEKMGCFYEGSLFQGTKMTNITPSACLQSCNWQGIVGIQEDRCLCEDDLGNSSALHHRGICHILCAGNPEEMCGGLHGISAFRPAAQQITWNAEEEEHDGECVLLRKRSHDPVWYLTASKCQLQTRYLCGFSDHEKCGDYHKCIRWSSGQSTWSESQSRCEAMGGHLAELVNGFGDYSQDLYNLPPGSYWLSLRRHTNWAWLNGSVIPPSDLSVRAPVTNGTCAVVQNMNGEIRLSPRPCHFKRRFLCQYDFDDKPSIPGSTGSPQQVTESRDDETNTKMAATRQYEATWRRNPFFDTWDDNITIMLESQSESSGSARGRAILNTCLFLLLGFLSGVVFVLFLGLLVYLIFRCKQPDPKKHRPLSEDNRSRHDNQSVTYSSKDDSIHIASPPSDITYDSVYDGESPFRRTQRLIRIGSANISRPAVQPRRERSDTINSMTSDYTWRGMIDGKVETVNTQLRQENPTNRDTKNYCEVEYDLHHIQEPEKRGSPRFKVSVNSACSINDDITTDLDALENHYDIPERLMREKSESTRRHSGVSGNNRTSTLSTGSELAFPKFLELSNQTDEFSNEENIYASIKKTFQKIERDLNKDQKDPST